jgi:hypothetical protein
MKAGVSRDAWMAYLVEGSNPCRAGWNPGRTRHMQFDPAEAG